MRFASLLKTYLAGLSCWLLALSVMQVGRAAFVVVYLTKIKSMDSASIDLIRERINERCRELSAMAVRLEVILTATSPFFTTGAS
jgi:hypothetical protein